MIISHAHQYIFLKTRKTGGTSFEIALSKYTSPEDVVTPISDDDEQLRASLGYRGPQNYQLDPSPHEGALTAYYNHIPARKVKAALGKALFKQYAKVSIVRNPFDMAVSGYFWAKRHKPHRISPKQFQKWMLARKTVNRNRRITHMGGRSVVDMMIRFEHFETDVGAFAQSVGLPSTLFEEMRAVKAKTSQRPRDMTTQVMFEDFPKGRQLIEEIFAEDIERYGYKCY